MARREIHARREIDNPTLEQLCELAFRYASDRQSANEGELVGRWDLPLPVLPAVARVRARSCATIGSRSGLSKFAGTNGSGDTERWHSSAGGTLDAGAAAFDDNAEPGN